ncbi:MAG: MlaD family protein [Bacteroidetes bacterium]|nr:MlaD family protein [Bacteroidota bacterium]
MKTKEFKVGLFVAIGITVLYFGYNFLKGKKFFSSYNRYYAVYNSVDGVVNSTPVYINGFKVGQVEKIGLLDETNTDKIVVTLFVDHKIKIGKGSISLISSTDLLGGKAIKIILNDTNIFITDKDTLIGDKELDLTTSISNMVAPIKDKSEQVLITLDKVLGSLRQVFDNKGTQNISNTLIDLSATLHNLRNATETLNNFASTESIHLQKSIRNVETTTNNIAKNSDNINKTIKNLSSITDSLAKSNLKSTINNLDKVSSEMALLLEKINKGEGTIGKLANDKELYDNLNKSSTELHLLLSDLHKNPSRYVHLSVFGGGAKSNNIKAK